MKVMVTGANGLVGSHLVARLAEAHEVVAVGRGDARLRGVSASSRYVSLDLADAHAMEALVREEAPAAVVHAAAMTDVDACERDVEGAYRVNHDAVAGIARACRAVSARLVALSTDYVFDGEEGPYGEDDVPNPRGVYARTKRLGEEAALLLAPDCAVARVAVVYSGSRAIKRTFALIAYDNLKAGREVRAFSDQSVTPTLADNAAAMCVALLASGYRGILHCTGATEVTRVEFCHALADLAGASRDLVVPVRMAEVNLPAPRPRRSALRVDRARELLGDQGPLALGDALARFADEVGVHVARSVSQSTSEGRAIAGH